VPALLILACMREGELAAGFGINTATAWRCLTATVALLAARAPKPSQALAATWGAGHAPARAISGIACRSRTVHRCCLSR